MAIALQSLIADAGEKQAFIRAATWILQTHAMEQKRDRRDAQSRAATDLGSIAEEEGQDMKIKNNGAGSHRPTLAAAIIRISLLMSRTFSAFHG